jgi:hypothetical protein
LKGEHDGGFKSVHVLVRNCRHHGHLIGSLEPKPGARAPSDCD